MKYRNPKFTENGLIDVEVEHAKFGWVPFTLDPSDDDAEFDTAGLDARVRAAGGIAAYVAPPPPPPAPADPVIEALEMLVQELPKDRRAPIAAKVSRAKAMRGV